MSLVFTLTMHIKAASYTCRMLNSTKRSLIDIKGCSINPTFYCYNKPALVIHFFSPSLHNIRVN